jgi:hypothetical protein
MKSVVALLKTAQDEPTPQAPRKSRPEPHVDDERRGRVTYLYGSESWQVYYVNVKGARSTSRKGLSVPTQAADGVALPPSAYMKAGEEKKMAAKKLWNELDTSVEPRFKL